ncbi:MAG: hypothetical protein LBT24_05930, partial [Tannerella sp.]|nr:hypothetical protein [Tannerella sp.]
FNDEVTIIAGANGLGKSRHFDAFMWLLFGKDTQDRKDYNVKTIGLQKVDCEVSAVLDISGESVELKRIYREKWVKPRGQVEEVFKGNETETYWNDVPVNVTEYQKRVSEVIHDSIFKMITNPRYFAGMKWQEQREQLFQLAGTITDAEIGAKKPEFATLLDKISGKSFADFKREISARKKRLKEDLSQIQPRIDQTYKMMPEKSDFAALEVEKESLEKQVYYIDKAISDKSEAMNQKYAANRKTFERINQMEKENQKILFDAQSKAREKAFEADDAIRDLERNTILEEKTVESLKKDSRAYEIELNTLKIRLEGKQKDVSELRQKWFDENAIEYNGDETCRFCNQPLPEHMKADAMKLFADSKEKKLAEITAKGSGINAEIARIEESIAGTKKHLDEAVNAVFEKGEFIAELKKKLAEMPVAKVQEVKPGDVPEYVKTTEQIEALKSGLITCDESYRDDEYAEKLREKKDVLTLELDAIKKKLQDRELIARGTQEIARLEEQGKDLAQQIADLEHEDLVIQEFTKTKIEECEKRINGFFHHVTFQLFEYTIDGNESETCVPLVNGVPFDVANTAGQVNAGLDIINALARFHGICAPIFIDNRESVNEIIKTESQIINLVVTKDRELIIK